MSVGLLQFGVSGSGFYTLPFGAGGYIIGLAGHSDGTLFIRTDTYGAYIGSTTPGAVWQQVVNQSSLPSAYLAGASNTEPDGVWAVAIDPQNSNNLWMLNGCQSSGAALFFSNNKGAKWTQCTAFTPTATSSAFAYRYANSPNMAVDPNNSNICFFGTVVEGLFIATSQGATVTQVPLASVPVGTDGTFYVGITGICFDAATATGSPLVTQTAYCCSYHNGIYATTNAGASWTKISTSAGQPAAGRYVINAQVVGGVYYCQLDDGSIWKYTGGLSGTWTNLVTGGASLGTYVGFAVNPSNALEMAYLTWNMGYPNDPAGCLTITTDGGAHWYTPANGAGNIGTAYVATDIPWLASSTLQEPNPASSLFWDPIVSRRLWVPCGVGVYYTGTIPTGTNTGTVTFNSQSKGIEQLVGIDVIWPPGATSPIGAFEDSPVMTPNLGSANPYPTKAPYRFGRANCLDYSRLAPANVCAMTDKENAFGNYLGIIVNNNYGAEGSWSTTPTLAGFPSGTFGGQVAMSTALNIVAVGGTVSQAPIYTTDGGTTWNPCSGLPTLTTWGAQNQRHRLFAADPLNSGHFYCIAPDGSGLYVSTNGGATWSSVTGAPTLSGASACLRAVVNAAGTGVDLWFSNNAGGQSGGVPLYYALNVVGQSSLTFSTLTGVTETARFDFGPPKIAGHYPTLIGVFAQGGTIGGWRCDDVLSSPTWTQWGTFTYNSSNKPSGSGLPVTCQLDYSMAICANQNNYGGVAGVTSGSGGWYYIP